jgi:VanZ family protein
LRRLTGSWRSVAAWAALILIATTVPLTDIASRAPVPWLDKLVHGALYLVLGWLVGAALCATGRRSIGTRASAVLALSVFALLDEVHQRWLPGRVASLEDWAADVVGATIGLTVGMILWKCAPATQVEDASRNGNREDI